MLSELIKEKNISLYRLSKDTGIPYSTLNDIVIEKTDIQSVSARTLYRLAKYLDLSMETLYKKNYALTNTFYLYNIGRNVIIECSDFRFQYLGPKNLVSFKRLNKIDSHVLYVETYFVDSNNTMFTEEDYIDLKDILGDKAILLDSPYKIIIGSPKSSEKQKIIDYSLLVSDNLAILPYSEKNIPDLCVKVVSISRPSLFAIIRLSDNSVVSSTMSKRMLDRSISAVDRNNELITSEIREVRSHA